MKVHYPKLYNMAHLFTFNAFTDFKGSNNYILFMAILMKLATCHIRYSFKRPLRSNAPTVRVLTSVILKVIGWAFRKLYPTKIPGMVHQGILAPQRLEL